MRYLLALRPHQWYKNLLVFLAVFFSGNIFSLDALLSAVVAFFGFCALSSASYVINDLADKKKDRLHPLKRKRPIASGQVSSLEAVLLVIVMLIAGVFAAMHLPFSFSLAALTYFVLSQAYTFFLKDEAFADILTIAVNFVIRAVAGAFAIGVYVSPWLVGGVFFFALFLVLGKRRGELKLLGGRARLHRQALKSYTPELVSSLSNIATTALVVSYALFVFFGEHQGLFVTLPVVLYAVFYYESLIEKGSDVSRNPHLAFKDKRILVSILLWAALTFAIVY